MVQRKCPKCHAIFYRKSNYDKHINKVFDCSTNKEVNIHFITLCQNVPNCAEIIPKCAEIVPNNKIEMNNEIIVDDNYCCYYCKKILVQNQL